MSDPVPRRPTTPWIAGSLLVIPGAFLAWYLSASQGVPASTSPRTTPTEGSAEIESTFPSPGANKAPPASKAPVSEPADSPERVHFRELERLMVIDKARALKWIEEADSALPEQGRFAEARKASRITLLVELGRMKEARELTYAFIDAHPTSEYRRLIQGQTGIHPRPGAPPGVTK